MFILCSIYSIITIQFIYFAPCDTILHTHCNTYCVSKSAYIYLSFCSMSLKTSSFHFYIIVILFRTLLEGEK